MPNITYMIVNWVYLLALAIWVGGMIGFVALFAPSLTAVLPRAEAGKVVGNFLGRFRMAVIVCILLLAITSAAKFVMWETITPWLLIRWSCLGGMAGLAAWDFKGLAPKLIAAKAAGDMETYNRLHKIAVMTMSMTLLLGLIALFLS